MRASIVIPTYNHCEDLLRPCLESVLKFTDLEDTEIIVVANGCTDETQEYLKDKPVRTAWIDEPAGYTHAMNEGIIRAKGEYVVALNNDTTLLAQPKHQWINALIEPFADPQVGISGPMVMKCSHTGRDFVVFFCAAIRKSLFDTYGLLDEIFSPGFGEDTDFACRIAVHGYKVAQVGAPGGAGWEVKDGLNVMVGAFPIVHKGHETYKELKDGDEIIKRNINLLIQRYPPLPRIQEPPKVYNVFSFNQELDLLEMRFRELFGVVDRFVISEGDRTFGDKPKPYYFKDNLERFKPYLSKVSHIMVNDWPDHGSWSLEHYQRDCLMRGLIQCRDNDIIVINDADEIPTADAIRNYRPEHGIQALEMDCYYYNLQTKYIQKWKQPRIVTYGALKKSNFWDIIYGPVLGVIPNAGKHLCYFGGVESIIKKVEDSAHQELNVEKFKDPDKIREAIEKGQDLFGRSDMLFARGENPRVQYHLGCGDDYKEGFINVDLRGSRIDVVWDLEQDWRFVSDNSADFVLAKHVFGHLRDKTHTMNELYRILRVGGRAELQIPSTDGRGAWQDPTHTSFWNANSWVYWCSNLNAKLTKGNQQCGFKGDFKLVNLTEDKHGFDIVVTNVILEKVPYEV